MNVAPWRGLKSQCAYCLSRKQMYDFQEQFYQMMTRVKEAERSRAASTPPKDDARITEIVNGLIVTRPVKKVEYITETKANESEFEIIVLNDSWEK